MAYWLVKSEPFKYSWQQLQKDSRTHWDGVRNYQAAKNMRTMKKGDLVFFYHSNEGKEIVGIVEIVKEFYPDPTADSDKFGLVDVKVHKALPTPVTLAQMKADERLDNMALIRQSRLSVCPVSDKEWQVVCGLGGVRA